MSKQKRMTHAPRIMKSKCEREREKKLCCDRERRESQTDIKAKEE